MAARGTGQAVKKKERKVLGRYCREIADKLELRDWWVSTRVGEVGGPQDRYDGKTWGASSDSVPRDFAASLRRSRDTSRSTVSDGA